jgi:hypothetical protein
VVEGVIVGAVAVFVAVGVIGDAAPAPAAAGLTPVDAAGLLPLSLLQALAAAHTSSIDSAESRLIVFWRRPRPPSCFTR